MDKALVIELEDFLSEEDQDVFENLIFYENFPWFYTFSATYSSESNIDGGDFSFFRHMFIWDTFKASPYAHLIRKSFHHLFTIVECEPRTVRANMTTLKEPHVRTKKHTDLSSPHIVGLYYVNDTDGDTVFFDGDLEERVSPQKGKLIIFDGLAQHAAYFPTKKDRAVINFVFPTNKTVTEIAAKLGFINEQPA